MHICLLTTQELDADPFPSDDWPCDPRPFLPDARWDLAVLQYKDSVAQVTELARQGGMSFEWAVVNGCFTVPGDGGLNFKRIFRQVSETPGFEGWWVVEAEQNPLTSNPYLYGRLAREFMSLEIDAINSGN